jgi:hypothetical protein
MLQHPKSTPTKLDNDGPTVLVVEDSSASGASEPLSQHGIGVCYSRRRKCGGTDRLLLGNLVFRAIRRGKTQRYGLADSVTA